MHLLLIEKINAKDGINIYILIIHNRIIDSTRIVVYCVAIILCARDNR